MIITSCSMLVSALVVFSFLGDAGRWVLFSAKEDSINNNHHDHPGKLTGDWFGLQIQTHPMTRDRFDGNGEGPNLGHVFILLLIITILLPMCLKGLLLGDEIRFKLFGLVAQILRLFEAVDHLLQNQLDAGEVGGETSLDVLLLLDLQLQLRNLFVEHHNQLADLGTEPMAVGETIPEWVHVIVHMDKVVFVRCHRHILRIKYPKRLSKPEDM